MKRSIRTALIGLAVSLLFISLPGCKNAKKEPETIVLEGVYKKEPVCFDERFYYNAGLDIIDSLIYVCGYMNGGVCIAKADRQSGNIEYLPIELTSPARGFCKTENGYAVVSGLYDTEANKPRNILYILSESGEITQTIDLTSYINEEYKIHLWSDNNNVYVVNGNKCVEADVTAGASNLLFDTSNTGTLLSVTPTNDAPLLLIENQYGARQLFDCAASGRLTENTVYVRDTVKTAKQIFSQSVSDLLIYNNSGIYHSKDSDMQLILSWSSSCINKDKILDFIAVNDAQFAMIYNDDNRPCLYYLSAAENQEDMIRTVIHVAYSETGAGSIPEAAVQFNSRSDKYHVICDEAASAFGETDTSAASQLSEFDKSILKGDIGDIVVFNSNYEKYAEKEIFLDLYELMKEDEDISKNDIFPCVLNSLEYNGHLYAAAPYFRIKTLVGKESNIPIKTGEIWDGSALIELNSSLSENQRLTAAINREYFTNMLLMYSAGAYIDFDNNKCSFNNEDFISLLKYINEIPEENDLAEDFGKTGIYRNDTCILYSATLCNIPDYFAVKYRFGVDEPLNFVGYPSPDGGKAVVAPYNYYAISSESAVREGAWEFIKFLMTEYLTLNSSDMNSNIPALKSFFDKWVEMQQSYKYIFEDDTAFYYPDLGLGNSVPPGYTLEITDALANEFLNYIESVSVGRMIPNTIYEIIGEEINRYFSGSITAEKAAEEIQKRVGVYLAEQG
ncbi:MAG: hypothetical protein ACOX4O_10750 [Eubacteriales bacterium]|jgi:ABC-type glycerol-3-phosphate transport system substrate-binding protein